MSLTIHTIVIYIHLFFTIICRSQDHIYCDDHGNCLPPEVGYCIPLFSFAINFILFVINSLDCLQPDTTVEKIEILTFSLTNLSIRVLTLILSLAYLGKWTVLLVVTVFCLNAMFFHFLLDIPDRYNKFSSWLLSLTNASLIVEDISRKERNIAEVKTEDEVKRCRKALSTLSLLNLAVFVIFTLGITMMIYYDLVHTDINNILTKTQIFYIFLYLFLPLTVLSAVSSLLLRLPSTSLERTRAVLNSFIFVATISFSIISGILVLPHSPRDILILAKVRDSGLIYSAKANADFPWNISERWTFFQENLTIFNEERNTTFHFGDNLAQLYFIRNMTEKEINVLSQATIYIDYKINPINWDNVPFRYSTYIYYFQDRINSI